MKFQVVAALLALGFAVVPVNAIEDVAAVEEYLLKGAAMEKLSEENAYEMTLSKSGKGDDDDDDDDDMDDLLQMELSELSPEEEDALGKAAREAVRKYEEEMRLAQKEKDLIRSSWDEEMVVAPVEDLDDVDDQEDDSAQEEDVDYSNMTVAELKEILRSKGLKVSGKKSELIERLNSS
mmetsp:Transcript_29771/g.61016  ORF Transcript_29771/g.61016 Transcript_29771/m.61016 type:complete len:179 (-) Transcript_29771:262-798(-)